MSFNVSTGKLLLRLLAIFSSFIFWYCFFNEFKFPKGPPWVYAVFGAFLAGCYVFTRPCNIGGEE